MTANQIISTMFLAVVVSNCSGGGSGAQPLAVTPQKSSTKDVLRFTSEDGVDFFIDESTRIITGVLVVVGDPDLESFFVTPTIVVSDKATISPASGVKQDLLKKPVVYTVTAEDGSSKSYTASVVPYELSGKDPNAKPGLPSNSPPQMIPWTKLVPNITSAFSGTWKLKYSGVLEVRQVGADTVLTLLEQTPTTQTVTVQVNGVEEPPTSSTGKWGWSATFNTDLTYSGSDDLGDTSTGTWSVVDLGAGAANRYELRVDETTSIPGGPSASGVVTWYVTGLTASELFLTRDPLVTSGSTATYNITLTR
jgi:hypothetical protein